MNTAIIYASKHNFTEECVKELSQKISVPVKIVNLSQASIQNINQYDTIVIGGPLYMGQPKKELKKFLNSNLDILKSKNIGLFICGLTEEEKLLNQFEQIYPQISKDNIAAKSYFGGGFTFSSMNFVEKFIIKLVTKNNKDMINIKHENIDSFAAKLNKLNSRSS